MHSNWFGESSFALEKKEAGEISGVRLLGEMEAA